MKTNTIKYVIQATATNEFVILHSNNNYELTRNAAQATLHSTLNYASFVADILAECYPISNFIVLPFNTTTNALEQLNQQ